MFKITILNTRTIIPRGWCAMQQKLLTLKITKKERSGSLPDDDMKNIQCVCGKTKCPDDSLQWFEVL